MTATLVNIVPPSIEKEEVLEILERIKTSNMSIRHDIYELNRRSSHKALGYKSFAELVKKELSFSHSRTTIYRHLHLAHLEKRIEPGQSVGRIIEIRLREIDKYDEMEQIRIWKLSKENAKKNGFKIPKRGDIKDAAKELEINKTTKTSKKSAKRRRNKPLKKLFGDISRDYTISDLSKLVEMIRKYVQQSSGE